MERPQQRANPSLTAQSSTEMLDVKPIALANPNTQFPLQSRMMPPPPTSLGFPRANPYVFSLTQFSGGFTQPIAIVEPVLGPT